MNNPDIRPLEALRLAEDDDEKGKSKGGEALESKLLKARTILVQGPVTDKMYQNVCARLLYLEHEDPKKEIVVVVNSPGGSADSGFGIYDMMRFVGCPIQSICAGLCASAAVLIFLGADKGRRFVLPHSRFLLHQPSTQSFGQASDMEITAKEILRTRKRYAEIVSQATGKDADAIQKDSNRDFWLDAQQALEYKLVDKIVQRRDEIK
ncbi:MAG: ATP-dependent Clp protease proteolytic subunit [Planctomycetota bacterium]|nr:ATP-dependent Clp protease proteolytic subunit [Planctomycetota bacterium]